MPCSMGQMDERGLEPDRLSPTHISKGQFKKEDEKNLTNVEH